MPAEVRSLGLQTRAAPIASVDPETRVATLCWSTGAPVQRFDYYNDRAYMEELSMDPKHIRLGRLQAGASLLDSHSGYGLGSILGVVESASVSDGEGLADVRFSSRAEVEPIFQDVRDGIIRHVSVGYRVYKMERIPPKKDGDPWIYRAIDWEPYEISLVAIPADPSAGVRAEQGAVFPCEFLSVSAAAENLTLDGVREMPGTTTEAAATGQTADNVVTQERAAPAAPAQPVIDNSGENLRVAGILEATRIANLPVAFAEEQIRGNASVDAVRNKIIAKLAEASDSAPVRNTTSIQTITDETDVRRSLMASAIAHRMDPRSELMNGAGEYRYMSLIRVAEECLTHQGVKVRGLAASQIAERAMHSTSDFPAILANVMSKRLREQYEENLQSYQRWARRAPNAPDFKNMDVVQLSATPDLVPLGENGEVKYGKMTDGKETYSVATFARGLGVSRQTVINDDLRAFDRIVLGFSGSARRLENRLVYAQLAGNPTMADGKTLFHAGHGNLATGAAIAVAGLSDSRKLMRKQKGLQGEELNLAPAYLIVPTDLEQAAYQFTSSQFVPDSSSNINEFRNGGRTALEPIVESLLDGYSTQAWYLAATNSQVDTIEYCYLEGHEGVYIESSMDFDVEGMKIKARLDFATKAIDYRGLVKNPGVSPA